MTRPCRIQRKRVKGWRMPAGAVYVGRGSRFGNPFRVGDSGVPDAHAAVRVYARWMAVRPDEIKVALRGRDLACWCPLDQPCHATWLLWMANNG